MITKDEIEGKIVEIKTTEAEIMELQEKIKWLQSQIKPKQESISVLEKEISEYMEVTNETDFRVSFFHVFFLETESLEVKDVKSLPENFKRVKVEADKVALKKALKEGQLIDGVSISVNKSLQIR